MLARAPSWEPWIPPCTGRGAATRMHVLACRVQLRLHPTLVPAILAALLAHPGLSHPDAACITPAKHLPAKRFAPEGWRP